MKYFLEKYWWAGEIGLLVLCFRFPDLFPLFIFIGIILFTQSKQGKALFDISSWDNDDISIKKEKPSRDETKKEPLRQNQSFSHSPMNNTPNKMSFDPKGFSPSIIIVALIGFLALSIMMDGVVSIPAGSTGVVFDKLSKEVKKETLPSGINFKIPFFQEVTVISTRIQEYKVNPQKNSIQPLTKDTQSLDVELTVQYFIDKDQAPQLFEKIKGDYENKVRAGVEAVVLEVILQYSSAELSAPENRKKAQEEIKSLLTTKYNENFITLHDVLITKIIFSEKYMDAIEQKQITEQNIQKAENEKKEAEVRKKITIVNAEAEAESIKLKGEALSNAPEIIQLEFVEKMAPDINWGILPDGAIPMINTSDLQKK